LRRFATMLAIVIAVTIGAIASRYGQDDSAEEGAVALPEGPTRALELTPVAAGSWPGARGGGALTGAVPRIYPRYERMWAGGLEGRLLSGPVVIGPRIYAGTDRGEIVGWSLGSGAEEFRAQTNYGPIAAPLAQVHGELLVGTLDGHFFRFDPAGSEVVWKVAGKAEIHGGANVADSAAGPLVVWGDYHNNVVAVAADSGQERWRYVAGNYVNGTPSTDGKHVVVGSCDARLYVLRTEDGKALHRFDTGAYVPNSPALVDGVAYSASYSGVVVAVALLDGRELWRVRAGNEGLVASPSVVEDKVLVALEDGTLVALNRDNGELLWQKTTGSSYRAGVVTDGKFVLAAGMDGRIGIYGIADGTEVWSEQVGGSISLTPAVVGARLVVVTEDGELVVYAGTAGES
jgi:eukaryotic-like serine/threonine-protein kinase